jgi:hypothetical protein
MNYSDDDCMFEFTPEQVNRMRCSITHYRPNLLQSVGPCTDVGLSVEAGEDLWVCSGSGVTLSTIVENGSGNESFSWTPTKTLDNPTSANPIASPTSETTYTVTVTDGNACPATDTVTVRVAPADPNSYFQDWFTTSTTYDFNNSGNTNILDLVSFTTICNP